MRHGVGHRDGLSAGDGKGLVLVGMICKHGLNEQMTWDLTDGPQYEFIVDALVAQFLYKTCTMTLMKRRIPVVHARKNSCASTTDVNRLLTLWAGHIAIFTSMGNTRLKAGVLGAGHLGKIHLRLLEASEKYDLVGFYDPDTENSQKLANEHGYTYYENQDGLFAACDVIDIVTPTTYHHESAMAALLAGCHVFIEKPVTTTYQQAQEIIALAQKSNLLGAVGQVERFNPAFQSVKDQIANPMFIETHRLAQFNPRGTDVSVVLDLMIHDIDAVLSVVNSEVQSISASGVTVISQTPDIANARIEFKNGCVANLTASRISLKNMRKARFFQQDAYISVDFLDKKCEVVRMKDAPENPGDFDMILQNAEGVKKQIYFDNPDVPGANAIQDELEDFADAIHNKSKPQVPLQDGAKALQVALEIISQFKHVKLG